MKKECNHYRLLFIFCLILGLMMFISLIHTSSTTGTAYFNNITFIDEEVWYLKPEKQQKGFGLYKDKEEKIAFLFPDKTYIIYSNIFDCYYYINDNKLMSYDPISNNTETVLEVAAHLTRIFAVTNNYYLLGNDDVILETYNINTMKKTSFSLGESNCVLDFSNNNILITYYLENEERICLYNLDINERKMDVLTNSSPDCSILDAHFYDNFIYYADTNGKLYYRENNPSSVQGFVQIDSDYHIIGMEPHKEDLILATLKDDYTIDFVLLNSDNDFEYIASWNNNEYRVPGSCLLTVNNDHIACALTTSKMLFLDDIK